MNPLIAIAMAAYKPDAHYFAEQLKSIQTQTHTDWICVITADSDVELPEEIRKDQRFHLFRNSERLGAAKNFEQAARHCLQFSPDFIAFSDQDDVWFPEKLQLSLKRLQELPPGSAVHTDMTVIDGTGLEIAKSGWSYERRGVQNTSLLDLLIRNIVAGCACLQPAQLIRNYLVIPRGVPMHDQWYPLLSAAIGRVESLSISTYAYRIHGGNVAGITPYRGMLQNPSAGQNSSWMATARRRYLETRAKAQGLRQAKLLPPWLRFLVLEPWDLGIGFLIYGALRLPGDAMLARACLARFIGKNLYFMTRQTEEL